MESVGGTSVSYDAGGGGPALLPMDTALLDSLIENACDLAPRGAGVGQVGVTLGGPSDPDDWYSDVDVWVLAGNYRKVLR